MDWISTLLVVGGSSFSFRLLNAVFGLLPSPVAELQKSWRWRNTCTSLTHSLLTGVGSLSCFYLQPQMVEDLISFYSLHIHIFVAASVGYFLHDFSDLFLNLPLTQCWEVLLHHSVVTSCFVFALTSRLCLGFAVVALLLELHSVFLHVRRLLLMSGRTSRAAGPRQASVAYRATCWLNLGTLLVFRLGTLCWMTRWLARHRERLPGHVLMLGTCGLSLISIMSAVLFYRLLRADLLACSTTKEQ